MKPDSVIVRFGGEIGIKGDWTRRTFEKLLLRNISRALKHHDISPEKILSKQGRIYITTRLAEETTERLAKVFGISSSSSAIQTTSDMSAIVERVLDLSRDSTKEGSSFAVRCRRVGQHTYTSMDICREAGKRILEEFEDRNLRVDLSNPDLTIAVEVREDRAYAFKETIRGVDGFPLGSQGKTVCLLSGGVDSAVACWLVMKRGSPIVPLHFNVSEQGTSETAKKPMKIAKKLFQWAIGFPRKVYVVPHRKNLRILTDEGPRKLTCILCKRLMYRIAEHVAHTERADGLVTGESIGEQASQTLTNLRVLDEAAREYPVHRPLLGYNKCETESLARKIGVFETVTEDEEGCSSAPWKPATKAKLEQVKRAEEAIDIEAMIAESLRNVKVITV